VQDKSDIRTKMRTVVSIGILMDFSFISSLLWNPPPIITRQGDAAEQGRLWRERA